MNLEKIRMIRNTIREETDLFTDVFTQYDKDRPAVNSTRILEEIQKHTKKNHEIEFIL